MIIVGIGIGIETRTASGASIGTTMTATMAITTAANDLENRSRLGAGRSDGSSQLPNLRVEGRHSGSVTDKLLRLWRVHRYRLTARKEPSPLPA
jgi:hypothetical protein